MIPRFSLMVLAAGFAAFSAFAAAYEIGEAFDDESFWKSDSVLFVKRHEAQGLKFTDEDRTSADSRRDGAVTCFGLDVYETRILFAEAGGIARVELMLYNRGGTEKLEVLPMAGGQSVRRLVRTERPMDRELFMRTLTEVRNRLTPAGTKAPSATNERTSDAAVRQRSVTWPKSNAGTVASLRWNFRQEGKKVETFVPGFIRLAVDGPSTVAASAKKGASGDAAKTAKGAKKIIENVIRDPRGDVFIDNVPMVDQGAKGYCAVSTAERVMRYFGLDVDEHEIGEAAGTDAEKGTSTLAMKQAVERIGRRYRLATKLLYGDFEADDATRIANLGKEVANYNKAAKKLKKPPITEDRYVTHSGNVTHYNLSAVDEAMDVEVLKEMKTNGAQKAKYTKFRKNVRQSVDAGTPLYWGVMLGLYPESDLPQSMGGHMRLIIGYNDKKDEILYTDSWGKGHELKRMPTGWAWTISRCLMETKPLK